MAADEGATAAADVEYRIFHLDCGRKYFTVDWLEMLINELSAAGYNQLQLAFGNDGLRFLLDDMSVGGYDDAEVKAAIEESGSAYFRTKDTDNRYLTQSEMDEIIAYGKSKGIEIVPLLNIPAHMNVLVGAMNRLGIEHAGYGSSTATIDFRNSQVADFIQTLLKKYAVYFGERGCRFFNFGADEFAGVKGIRQLVENGEYQEFAAFLNRLAAVIKENGLTPRAFNDCFYYNQQEAVFDSDVQICYWSSGSSNHPVAPLETFINKGHEVINTNDTYYWVLGNPSWQCDVDLALEFENTEFLGGTYQSPIGAMFCLWCDHPNVGTEMEIAQSLRLVLRAIGARMQNSNDYSAEILPEGFPIRFSDVPENAWYTPYVYDLVDRNVIRGMSPVSFAPDGLLTRAQFAKMAAASFASPEDLKAYEGQTVFDDVSAKHWASACIAWAKNHGIVFGTTDTAFEPEATITREQIVAILGRYAENENIILDRVMEPQVFYDGDQIAPYAQPYVALLQESGIINGRDDGFFDPQGYTKRSEAVKLMSLFLEQINRENES